MISVYSDASVSSKSLKLSANSTFHELSSKENQINEIQKEIKELKLKIKQIQDSVETLSNYENFLINYRKSGLIYRNVPISVYAEEKIKDLEFLKTLEEQKEIQKKEADCLKKKLIKYEKILQEQNKNSYVETREKEERNVKDLKTENSSVFKAQETEFYDKNKQLGTIFENNSYSKQQQKKVSLEINVFPLKNSENLKKSSQFVSADVKSKVFSLSPTPQLGILDNTLSRANQERLSKIDKKLKHAELFQNSFSPTLERAKKFQFNDTKFNHDSSPVTLSIENISLKIAKSQLSKSVYNRNLNK